MFVIYSQMVKKTRVLRDKQVKTKQMWRNVPKSESRWKACRYSLYSSSNCSVNLIFLKIKTGGPKKEGIINHVNLLRGQVKGTQTWPLALQEHFGGMKDKCKKKWAGQEGSQGGDASGFSRLHCAALTRKASDSVPHRAERLLTGSTGRSLIRGWR